MSIVNYSGRIKHDYVPCLDPSIYMSASMCLLQLSVQKDYGRAVFEQMDLKWTRQARSCWTVYCDQCDAFRPPYRCWPFLRGLCALVALSNMLRSSLPGCIEGKLRFAWSARQINPYVSTILADSQIEYLRGDFDLQ